MRGKRVVVVVAVVGLLAATAARLLPRAATPVAPGHRGPGAGLEPRAGRAPPLRAGDPVPPAAVRVVVYDAAGKPVPGAEVAAARDGDASPRRAEADGSGRAVFEGLDPAVDWMIAARAPGFAPTLVPGVRPGDFVQAVLTPGLRVHGTVRLPDERPCPGARVRLTLRIPGSRSGSGGFETNADESGAYEFLRMPVVPFEIEATWNRSLGRSRSFEPGLNAAEQRVDVVIEQGAIVTGTVRDAAGRPLAGIWVIVRRPGGARYEARAETAADGGYALGGLDGGPFVVEASDPSNRRVAATAEGVSPPRTGLDFTLADDPAAPGTYGLRVVDAEGRPVPFLRVVELLPGRDEPVGTREDSPDADGVVRGAQIAAGRRRLRLRAPEGFAETPEFEIRAGAETDLGTVRLEPGAAVRGRLLDPDGSPAAGAKIYAGLERLPERGQPDASGRFALRGLAPAEGFLRVALAGCEVLVLPWQAAAGATADLPDARLRRAAGTVRGRARARSGAIPPDARATLSYEAAMGFAGIDREAPVGADGAFEFLAVPAGRWRLSVSVPDRPTGWKQGDPVPYRGRVASPFELAEGATREMEVEID